MLTIINNLYLFIVLSIYLSIYIFIFISSRHLASQYLVGNHCLNALPCAWYLESGRRWTMERIDWASCSHFFALPSLWIAVPTSPYPYGLSCLAFGCGRNTCIWTNSESWSTCTICPRCRCPPRTWSSQDFLSLWTPARNPCHRSCYSRSERSCHHL